MSELIDRQAAIDVIDKEQKEIDVSDVSAMYAYSKCKTIIKQLPSALGTNLAEVGTDTISRQAAINKILGQPPEPHYPSWYAEQIKELPSAQPKKGKWIKTARWGRVYYCNQCRNYLDFDGVNAGRGSTNFCPNCGADMRGGQDE